MSDDKKKFDFETLLETPREELPSTILQYDIVDLECEDLSDLKELRFKDDAKVLLGGDKPLPQSIDLTNCSDVDLSGRDTSKIPPQKLKEGSTFYYSCGGRLGVSQSGLRIQNLPPLAPNVDISRCQNVYINGADLSLLSTLKFAKNANVSLAHCTNFPPSTNLSNLNSIDLSGCDLSQIKNIKFKDGASVNLSGAQNIPESIDLSNVNTVDLSGCDLSQVKNIKFKDGASVNLAKAQNLPESIDLSNVNTADLSGCDLSQVKNIKFKDGAAINLAKAQNLPESIDFSNLNAVNLSGCDLSQVKNIKFKDGASVNLSGAQNLPESIDFSNLNTVNLSGCDLSQVKNLCFKNNADVDLRATKNLPENLNVSNCSNVWATFDQTNNINVGQANIILAGIGVHDIDVSNLQNFTTATTEHPTFKTNYTSFLSTKSFTFKNQQQYDEYKKNPNNIPLPESCQILFADKERLKADLKEQTGELPKTTPIPALRLHTKLQNKQQNTDAPSKQPTPQKKTTIPQEALTAYQQKTR